MKKQTVKKPSLDDATLLKKIAAGSNSAWDIFVRRHADTAYALALRMLQNAEDAEDALQETFLRIHASAGTFTYGEDAKSWVSKIACREALKMIKRQQRRQSQYFSLDNLAPDFAVSGDASAISLMESGEVKTLLEKALSALPESIRLAIVMHFSADMNQEQIANEFNCDQSTISNRLKKGMELLRNNLKAAGISGSAFSVISTEMLASPGNLRAPSKVLRRIRAIAPRTSVSTSAKIAARTASTPIRWWLAGTLLCGVIAMAVATMAKQNNGSPNTVNPTTAPVKTVEKIPPDSPRGSSNYLLDFEKEETALTDRVKLLDGNLRWAKLGDGGCLENQAGEQSYIMLTEKIPRLPVLLAVRTQVDIPKGTRFGIALEATPNQGLIEFKQSKIKHLSTATWYQSFFYLTKTESENAIVTYIIKESVLLKGKYTVTMDDIARVQFTHLLPNSQLVIGFSGQQKIDWIKLMEVDEGLPKNFSFTPYLEVIRAVPLEKRKGEVLLKPKQKFFPKMKPAIRFYQPNTYLYDPTE